jgi:hypothetical protein
MGLIYTCDRCGETYEKGWTDEEADAEYAANFPGLADEPRSVICEDCYQAFMVQIKGVEALPTEDSA